MRCCCVRLAFGQTITATLQGRVADSSGAVLTKATVTATNTDTGLSRSVTCDACGEYNIASLPVGNYKVEVKAGTFQPQSRTMRSDHWSKVRPWISLSLPGR